ncbi:hypothetical protein XENOCAPTIV_029487, partial [Xenoophorus captivus]
IRKSESTNNGSVFISFTHPVPELIPDCPASTFSHPGDRFHLYLNRPSPLTTCQAPALRNEAKSYASLGSLLDSADNKAWLQPCI